jgi:hypothetical protein
MADGKAEGRDALPLPELGNARARARGTKVAKAE